MKVGGILRVRAILFACAIVVAGSFAAAPSAWAQTVATVTGTVKDTQGGIVPGATVLLISETRGLTTDTTTNATGDFTFPSVVGDSYTLRVTMDGFKTLERKGIAVTAGDRAVVGTLAIEVGALAETVTVSGEAPLIQAQSGERSFTVTTEAVQNLPLSNRNYGALAALTPGVLGNTRLGAQGGSTNFQLDGVSAMDTGSNGQALQLNVDAISEVKVLTQGYQAEYGRSGGMQVTGITKSGTNQFRGSVYDIHRNSDWNTNSWANQRNGDPKNVSKQQDWGYTFGGPIGKPGGSNNWFFFYAHEYRPRTSGGNINRFRVPTALERQGDFSESRDQNGNLINLIRDASTGLPCTAANTAGCFQDGGVLGRVPQSRQYALGMNILKLWPMPNTTGLNYNLETVAPEDKRLTQQPTIRLDYQASSNLRLNGKYAGQRATVKQQPGSIPGFNDSINQWPFVTIASGTVNYTLTPTTVLEGTYGFYENSMQVQTGVPMGQASNRCNVGLCDLPLLYPNAGIVPADSYQERALTATGTPMYANGRVMLPPSFQWGNRISNAPPSQTFPEWLDMVATNNVAISLTKLAGSHTFKAGYQLDHSLKMQNLGVGGSVPFQGRINFGNDTNNPLDSGFGFANAALGVFTTYEQQNGLLEGNYIYNSHEFYVQDNWKMSNRFSLDYGLRFVNQGPQYDTKEQASNFFPEQWSLANAPQLYRPGCAVATTGACPSASRIAINPLTGASLGANSGAAIGTIVPNTGSITNGIIQAGKGIAKENYTWPTLALAPRVGAAYDVSGRQSMVVRGSFGMFFDRLDGNSVFSQIGNPPTGLSQRVQNGQLQNLGEGTVPTQGAPSMAIFQYDSGLPTSVQWNAGVQMALPWSSSLDVSYVGTHGYNLRGQTVDINSPDIGSAYLPQNQDPTLSSTTPGGAALATDLMRPYRGIGAINAVLTEFWNQYDSIQTSFNRRFRNGVQATFNWTLGLRQRGNTNFPLRLQHNADGTYQIREDQREFEELLGDTGLRRHVIKANAVWDMPDLRGSGAATRVIGAVINDWQLSGIFTGGSGAAYDPSFTYNSAGNSVNLTGSPSYNGRLQLVGDPGSGCSDDQYAQFNAAAFAGPTYGTTGLGARSSLLHGCADKRTDLAIQRSFRLGGNKQASVRVDMFNAFNAVVINGRRTEMQLNSPTDQTLRNPQFNADGSPVSSRLTPRNAGFGGATGAEDMRSVQLQLRFNF